MDTLLARQEEILSQIKTVLRNFKKDSPDRKTTSYIKEKIEKLDNLWEEFERNNKRITILAPATMKDDEYFVDKVYEATQKLYTETRLQISSFDKGEPSMPASKSHGEEFSSPTQKLQPINTVTEAQRDRLGDLMSQQMTNFRALNRVIKSIDVNAIEDKWELEDELRSIQARWATIDQLHLQIDNILQGSDRSYDAEFLAQEKAYKDFKRKLNQKLSSTMHLQQSTPKLEIPVFFGKYTQWPTFYDLYMEAIHFNSSLTKAQKMQHLKGKLKGEAERLIQHLHISADNYDTAWEILTHRYNNPQLLFTNQIETFLSQPNVHKQTSFELKRLHDTTMECIHAIRNLGVDTTSWDPLLVHLIAKKLDVETYSDYKESRKSPRELPSLDELMNFIEGKFTALEPIQRKAKELSPTPAPDKTPKNYGESSFRGNYRANTTNTYLTCPLCSRGHLLYTCKTFKSMSPEEKKETITQFEICVNCLKKHSGGQCTSQKRCKKCDAEHNTTLHAICADKQILSSPTTSKQPSSVPTMLTGKRHNVNHVAADDEEILLTTLLIQVQKSDGTYVTLRALLDQGSQISLLSENAAQTLGLQRHRYHASVSGIGTGAKQSKGLVTMECRSIYQDYQFTTQALVISKVISNLPNTTFGKQSWPHLQHLQLADPEYNVSRPIDMLLDASIYSEIIMSGLIKGSARAPIAQQTKLGWILSGSVKTFNCNVVLNNLDDISKYWELEDINSPASDLTTTEQYCEELYQATTTRSPEDGRYIVALPMKPEFEEKIGSSKGKAVGQFMQLEQKMQRKEAFADSYKSFIDEYQELSHMRPVTEATGPRCYLPHHGVFKMDSTTTKLRVVFNASSKTTSGHSLNDLMECGPNLQQDLQQIILNWRRYQYVITADIEKMFRQIFIREQDQQLQIIIWRNSPQEELRDYQLTTVTYGTKAAPYLAMRTLRQLAKDDRDRYPLAATALEKSFYMDDLLHGENSINLAKEVQHQLIDMLKGAGMNLRKWSSNDHELIKDLPSEKLDRPYEFKCTESRKTLGLRWNPNTDTFTFQNTLLENSAKGHTKRQLLSDISKIFDPLGWLSPLTVRAKLLFQRAWSSGASWDENVSEEILQEWTALKQDFRNINTFTIPRHLGHVEKSCQLHGFCDASEKAYACVIYLVTANDRGEYTAKLVAAKTKLAPLNKIVSLPRLELCSALLLSQLMRKVLNTLSLDEKHLYAWTDSMIALGWLQGDASRWKQFVAIRVKQIVAVIPATKWRHVCSEQNPADSATRGISASQLSAKLLWWGGPEWLTTFDPSTCKDIAYEIPTEELKKSKPVVAVQRQHVSIIQQLLAEHSSITRVVKIVGWIMRFYKNATNKLNARYERSLSSTEFNDASESIVRDTQSYEFYDDIKNQKTSGRVHKDSNIACLSPFIDDRGLLRVGGRLNNSTLSTSAKHPLILSNHSRLTELLVHQAHVTTLHGGPRLTLSYIREKYWIISGLRTVKRQLRQCVKCRRFSSETRNQIMADLPRPRVTPSRPFTHTGVDFTGHVELKASKGRGIRTLKGYIAVFVCLATKAVHLELVTELSTAAFLAAFQRFRSRKGSPRHMYSDNGTNFVGANRLLKKEYQEILRTINQDFFNNINELDITWHFNAPSWPSAGGLWESAVKSVKHHLKRVIGDQRLTYEEYATLLCQVEACLNSRPLCALTESPDDECLTPGHFLVGGPLLSRPQTDEGHIKLGRRWQLVQSLNKQFWKGWSTEYLQQLQVRSKWRTPTKNLQVGDVVIIKEDNLAPGSWALGRVLELHPGRDGRARVVTLKTQKNVMKRPVSKLIVLPVNDTEAGSDPQNQSSSKSGPDTSTRPRRNTQKGAFKHVFYAALLGFIMLLAPSAQQDQQASFNITPISDNQGLYYDSMSNLRYIRDEWKLVVHYDLTTYWKGVKKINEYVKHLKDLCISTTLCSTDSQYQSTIQQLEHEITEIEHYDTLLQNHTSRRRRGLINGIGYVANSLFGVLDERFAEQYEKDINQIAHNENHLQTLIKNQTLVLEAESNILHRNEDIMNRQFMFIKQHLYNLTARMNEAQNENRNRLYLTSSSLAASVILSNLRSTQQSLIDIVTDIRQGGVYIHVLSAEQLQQQMSIISNQIKGDLTLPVDNERVKEMYHLLKAAVRVFNNHIIIEIRIPLLSNELYQLDRIISVPIRKGPQQLLINPALPYIAFNLKKDLAILLSDTDLQGCVHVPRNTILCSLEKPVYNLHIKQSICDIKLVNSATISSACTTELSICKETWIKLHNRNAWLFACCEECAVRIFCTAGVLIKTLRNNGIITLGQGCTLKGSSFSIYAHNNFYSNLHLKGDTEVPEVSILNKLINTTVSDDMIIDKHDPSLWHQLKRDIDDLKVQSTEPLTIHDIHHYTLLYIILAIFILGGIIAYWRIRDRKQQQGASADRTPPRRAKPPPRDAEVGAHSDSEVNAPRVKSHLFSDLGQSVLSVDQASSPIVFKAKRFNVSSEQL